VRGASLQCHWRLAIELVLQRTFEHIGNFHTRVGVHGKRCSRSKVDPHLDDLANGVTKIAARELGTPDFGLLRLCQVQRQTTSNNQPRSRDSSRSHMNIPSIFKCAN
jgi:hypothetical protein